MDGGEITKVSAVIDYMRNVFLNALQYFQKDTQATNQCRAKAVSLLTRVDDLVSMSRDLSEAYKADSEGNKPWVRYNDPSNSFPEILEAKMAFEEFLRDGSTPTTPVYGFFYAIQLYYFPPALPADYLDTIRTGTENPNAQPEWLGRISERLYRGGHYKSVSEVDRDVKSVFHNAIVYWQAQAAKGIKETTSEMAMKLAGSFGKIWDKNMAKASKRLGLAATGASIPPSICTALDQTAVAAKSRAARAVFPIQQQQPKKQHQPQQLQQADTQPGASGSGSGGLLDSIMGDSSSSSSSAADSSLASSSNAVPAPAPKQRRTTAASSSLSSSSSSSSSSASGLGNSGGASSGAAGMIGDQASRCLRILDRLDRYTFTSPATGVSVEVCQYFRDPVTDDVAPGYSSVITRPMWIKEVRRKLAAGEYPSPVEFKADVEQITFNCLAYNPAEQAENADIRFLANKLKEMFWRYYNDAFQAGTATGHHAPSSSAAAAAASASSSLSSSSAHPRSTSPSAPAPVAGAPSTANNNDGGRLELKDLETGAGAGGDGGGGNNTAAATSALGASGTGQPKFKFKLKVSSSAVPAATAASGSTPSGAAAFDASAAFSASASMAAAFNPLALTAPVPHHQQQSQHKAALAASSAAAGAGASAVGAAAAAAAGSSQGPALEKVLPPLLRIMGGFNQKDAEKVGKAYAAAHADAVAKPQKEKQLASVIDRMFNPQTLDDLRLAPPTYQGPRPSHVSTLLAHNYPSYDKALADESPDVANRRAGTLNAFYRVLNFLKNHDWFALFEGRWIDLNKQAYSQYPEAVHQAVGLGAIMEKFRNQLPRKQVSVNPAPGAAGKAGKTVTTTSYITVGGSVKEAYLNVGEVIRDIGKVLDIAIKIHSPPTWHGPPLVGRDVAKKAEHLKKFLDYWADEYFADSVLPLLPRREANRTRVHDYVCSRSITTESKDILNKLHKKLVKPGGELSKLQRFFQVPANEMWPTLNPDYFALVKQPMDLRTVGDKLKFKKYGSHGELYEDVRRVWSNAMLYNKGRKDRLSEEVFNAAAKMEAEFTIIWAEFSLELWDKLVCTAVKEEAQAARDENKRKEDEELQRIKAQQELEIHSQKASDLLLQAFTDLKSGGGINPTILPPGEQLLSTVLQAAYNSSQRANQYESEVSSLLDSLLKLNALERGFASHLHGTGAGSGGAASASTIAGGGAGGGGGGGYIRSLLQTLKADSTLVETARQLKIKQQQAAQEEIERRKRLVESQAMEAKAAAEAEAAALAAAAAKREADAAAMALDGNSAAPASPAAAMALPGSAAALSGHKRTRETAGLAGMHSSISAGEDAAFLEPLTGNNNGGGAAAGAGASSSSSAASAKASAGAAAAAAGSFVDVSLPSAAAAGKGGSASGKLLSLKGFAGLLGAKARTAAVFVE